MAKKVLLQGYLYAVLDCDLAKAMEMVGTMVTVETDGYGKDLRAVEKEDGEISFTLINENQFIRLTDEKESMEFLRKKREDSEKLASSTLDAKWKLEKELKKAKEEIAILKNACPKLDEVDLPLSKEEEL